MGDLRTALLEAAHAIGEKGDHLMLPRCRSCPHPAHLGLCTHCAIRYGLMTPTRSTSGCIADDHEGESKAGPDSRARPNPAGGSGGVSLTKYTVRYQAADYSGTRVVCAEDEEQAVAIVRARIRKEMSLPMYHESYRVVDAEEVR